MGRTEGRREPQEDGRATGGRAGGFQMIAGWTAGGMGAFAWLLTELSDRLDSQFIALLALIPSVLGLAALLVLTGWAVVEMSRGTGSAGPERRGDHPKEDEEHP